jgi:hypothetical protein
MGILAGGYIYSEMIKNCVDRWAYWQVDIYIYLEMMKNCVVRWAY